MIDASERSNAAVEIRINGHSEHDGKYQAGVEINLKTKKVQFYVGKEV